MEKFRLSAPTAEDACAFDCPECGHAMDREQTSQFGPVMLFDLTCPACGRRLAASVEMLEPGDAEPPA